MMKGANALASYHVIPRSSPWSLALVSDPASLRAPARGLFTGGLYDHSSHQYTYVYDMSSEFLK